jgi:transcriptional regulator with XRE-family HTH domain
MGAISERLKGERLRLKMSQEEMARAGGVARSAQGNYERGDRSPDIDYLAAVSLVGVDVGFVVTGVRAETATNLFDARTFAVCERFQRANELDRQFVERFLHLLDIE